MTQEQQGQRDAALVTLGDLLGSDPGQARTIWTLTTFGRGETDHVRLFVACGDDIREITWHAAALYGRRVAPGKGIALRGGGYSKGLEAADDVWRGFYGRALDQSRWREL
jgi:hypothetical protein